MFFTEEQVWCCEWISIKWRSQLLQERNRHRTSLIKARLFPASVSSRRTIHSAPSKSQVICSKKDSMPQSADSGSIPQHNATHRVLWISRPCVVPTTFPMHQNDTFSGSGLPSVMTEKAPANDKSKFSVVHNSECVNFPTCFIVRFSANKKTVKH